MFKVMKSTSVTRFNHLLFNIIVNDKLWIFKLDVLHWSIQHNNRGHHDKKRFNLNNTLLPHLGL